MNKSELIDAIAADAGITKAAAKLALENFFRNVSGTLKKVVRISLVGFDHGQYLLEQQEMEEILKQEKRFKLQLKML
jgi:nucleoid DNA-binding protein